MKRLLLISGITLLSVVVILASGHQGEAAKAEKSPPQSSSSLDYQDFGVSGIEVRSVKSLDTGKLNVEISQAAAKGEAWTKEAVLVALKVTGTDLQGHTKIMEVKTPPEQRDTATITVTASGYPDDAVGGERWRCGWQRARTASGPYSRRFGPGCAADPVRGFIPRKDAPDYENYHTKGPNMKKPIYALMLAVVMILGVMAPVLGAEPGEALNKALLAHFAKIKADPKYIDPHQTALIDLNGDGHEDASVLLQNPLYFCGTGGCTMLMFKGTTSGFQFVSRSTFIGGPVLMSDTKTLGWRDLWWRFQAAL